MMPRFLAASLLLLALLPLPGCDPEGVEFERELKNLMEEKRGQELLDGLLELDQRYPDRLVLKVNIGGLLLAAGQRERAGAYLKRGEDLAARSRDRKLQSLLYTNLAEYAYRGGEAQQGLDWAERSLELDAEDSLGAVFTKGKCLLALGRQAEALQSLAPCWPGRKDLMSREDMIVLAALFGEERRSLEALEVLRELQLKYGYQTGMGLRESALFEDLGRIPEGVLAAFKELEYQRYRGAIGRQEILARLAALERSISVQPVLMRGLRGWLSASWGQAALDLEQAGLDAGYPFARLLLLSARLESGRAVGEDFREYVGLEPHFRDFPGFYYHLWRGMKKGGGEYSLATVRSVLERCILLAPQGEAAGETRVELGRLIGLSPQDGARLLLGPELDRIRERVLAGSSPEVLQPVLELLATAENVYELAGTLMLRRILGLPGVSEYLAGRERSARGRMKERLAAILASGS